jgi:protoheme IX farnesyltransferase
LNATAQTFSPKSNLQDFLEEYKARLAVSVVFSSIAGYLLGFVKRIL